MEALLSFLAPHRLIRDSHASHRSGRYRVALRVRVTSNDRSRATNIPNVRLALHMPPSRVLFCTISSGAARTQVPVAQAVVDHARVRAGQGQGANQTPQSARGQLRGTGFEGRQVTQQPACVRASLGTARRALRAAVLFRRTAAPSVVVFVGVGCCLSTIQCGVVYVTGLCS